MQFSVIAARPSGEVVTLEVDASDEAQAKHFASEQGLDPISVRTLKSYLGPLARKKDRFPLLLFTQELISLLQAGLTLLSALQALQEKDSDSPTGQVLARVIAQLNQGKTFSVALEQQPRTFPLIYISTIRASERTGDLDQALGRYVRYLQQVDVLKRKLTNALIYPSLLMFTGFGVVLFLLFYVVPKFSHIYEDLGSDLPFLSRLMIEWGKLFEQNGSTILVMGAVLTIAIGFIFTRPSVKLRLTRLIWSIPTIGNRFRIYQLSRFYRTLGMLLRSGTPILVALNMAGGMLTGTMRVKLHAAADAIQQGLSISDSMQANDLTTPIALRLLRVGEQSGQMGEMMERISLFYDEEMARWIDWATRVFEPVLMAFIGITIGMVVVLMYMPIFELAGSIE